MFTDGYTYDMLQYDIRAYYSTEGTYADPYYTVIYGQLYRIQAADDNAQSRPTEYALANYPNPFNPATTIVFQLVEAAEVELAIYNMQGRRVARLVDGDLEEGFYRLEWSGKDASGQALASGHYFARLVVSSIHGGNKRVLTQKLLLMK